jgi:hypothetical protein
MAVRACYRWNTDWKSELLKSPLESVFGKGQHFQRIRPLLRTSTAFILTENISSPVSDLDEPHCIDRKQEPHDENG